MIYAAVPHESLTREIIAASTSGRLDHVPTPTPEGRVILAFRGPVPSGASRYVTREGAEAMRSWVDGRTKPEDADEAAALSVAHREALVERLGER